MRRFFRVLGLVLVALVVAVGLSFSLTGCDTRGNIGTDGYRFEEAEWVEPVQTIEFVYYSSLVELLEAADKAEVKIEKGHDLHAWGEVYGTRCRVHVIDPSINWQPEWVGHEVAHCTHGRWHS